MAAEIEKTFICDLCEITHLSAQGDYDGDGWIRVWTADDSTSDVCYQNIEIIDGKVYGIGKGD